MATISLTEFNQNPSRATRLADTEDLTILRRGRPAYRLVRARQVSEDPIDALVGLGVLSVPRARVRRSTWSTASSAVDLGAALDADRRRLDD